MIRYFAQLPWTRLVLWCYLMWYLAILSLYFDPSPALWLTSLGISAIIGTALILSTASAHYRPDKWTLFRLFLMPFCVSSYSALIKDKGFIVMFPPHWGGNGVAATACVVFLAFCGLCKVLHRENPPNSAASAAH
ncbi:MAG: hypothetical protein V4640_05925 [Verrucomicrobiota bacterium]